MRKFLVLLAAACLAGCSLNVDTPGDHPTDPASETFDVSLGIDIASMTKTEHGVYYKDLKPGTGQALTGTPFVLFTFSAYVKNGARFAVGTQTTPVSLSSQILGLQEGMQGMKVQGRRLIVVPSALGFGPNPAGAVPPNSTLIFDVQLEALP